MGTRVLSTEASVRLIEFMRENKTPPLKVLEHRERISELLEAGGRNPDLFGIPYSELVYYLASLQHGLDQLVGDWADDVQRLRWVDMPKKLDLSVDEVVRECVSSTESVMGALGVEVLAAYLDACGHNNLLQKLATRYLLRVRPLLEESLPFQGKTRDILTDSKTFFSVSDDQEARDRLCDYFHDQMRGAPRHVVHATAAFNEFGLGNWVFSIQYADFAEIEKQFENFEELALSGERTAEINAVLLALEQRKAEILINLLKEARAS